MSFYRKIKYFLVHSLMLSNKRAQELIEAGKIEIDGIKVYENCLIEDHSEVKVNGKIERKKKEYVYYKFYKPRGFESTLNKSMVSNVSDFFREHHDLAIAGRLDKQSEGLLLLSNNGKWVEQLCNPKFEKEKEYLVWLDKNPNELFLSSFRTGVFIGDCTSKTCTCELIEPLVIKVILKEGKNRQIRRMCKVLGYEVVRLKRIRVHVFELSALIEGAREQFYQIGD